MEYERALEEFRAQEKAFGFDYASQDKKVFKFYTGIEVAQFNKLLYIIGDSADEMKFSCGQDSPGEHSGRDSRGPNRRRARKEELFLTLCKLRHNFPESDLARRFDVSQPTISRIFRTWMLCLF